jgi:excisionase family DNA binding protein
MQTNNTKTTITPLKHRLDKLAGDMLTIDEVASWLRVHPITIRRWEKQNHLKSYRIGPKQSIRFMQKDVADFIAHNHKYGTKRGIPQQKSLHSLL